MRKLIVSIHLLLLFISCSEQKPSEYIEEIKIAGKVYSDNFSKTLNDVEVELKGDQVLMDTTDNEGNFLFFYKLKVNIQLV